MINSTTKKGVARIRRRPTVAVARNYKEAKVAVNDGRLLTRDHDIVIRRPVKNVTTQATRALHDGQIRHRVESQQNGKHAQIVGTRMAQRKASVYRISTPKSLAHPTSQELKQQAISQALAKTAKSTSTTKKANKIKVHFGFKRILLATACAAVAVFAIVYFVNLNAPSISLKVAAMQSGIQASYPAYVPRDFSLSDITSENGKITLSFKNTSTGDAFAVVEEKSSWDSNALFNNFIKSEYGDNYTLVREQGLTLYISDSNAAWVNGGVVYKLKAISGSLTKKQIKSIAVSM